MTYTLIPIGNGESMTKFILAICTFGLLFLGGCTGDDKDSTDSAADSAAE